MIPEQAGPAFWATPAGHESERWLGFSRTRGPASPESADKFELTNRYDPHDRIHSVGGSGWKYSQPDAIKYIEAGLYSFYVYAGGRIADVIIARTDDGNKYLKTRSDGIEPDNLLSLPECL